MFWHVEDDYRGDRHRKVWRIKWITEVVEAQQVSNEDVVDTNLQKEIKIIEDEIIGKVYHR